MKRIYTVQHTQSEHHTNGMVGSWTDWNLTDLGKQQADRIAEKLKQELDGKEIILYTSDLKRAKQTADSIASRFRVEPIVRKELRERNLGRCCGKSVQWLRENLECDEKTIDDRLFSDASLDVSAYIGKTIDVTMFVKTSDKLIRVGVDGSTPVCIAEVAAATDGWTEINAKAVLPEGERSAKLYVETDGKADFFVDDVFVRMA